MRAQDGYTFQSATTANSPAFQLVGGVYVMDANASWNSGSITLSRLGPDGQTYITAANALTADGTTGAISLPQGQYRFTVASAAALSVSVARVPGE